MKLSSFCVFSLVLLGGTSTGSEVRLKDHTFFGMFSSLSSHPLNGFLSSFSPFSVSGSWKESRQVRYGRRLSKGLWTSKLMVCNRFPTFSCQHLNPADQKKAFYRLQVPAALGRTCAFTASVTCTASQSTPMTCSSETPGPHVLLTSHRPFFFLVP